MRFRSLMFNLRDAKNPHFIMVRAMPRRCRGLQRVARTDHSGVGAWQAVICGQIHTSNLATMEVREMASDEMKKARLAGTAGTNPPLLPHLASHRHLVRKKSASLKGTSRCGRAREDGVDG